MADIISNQLARQLTEMVDNFTLLDILSKEEQEDVLSSKIDNIKAKNKERLRRHQEIEADKALALGNTPVASPPPTSPTSPLSSASPISSASPTLDFRSEGGGSSCGSSTGSRPGTGRSGGSGRRKGTSSPVDQQAYHRPHADVLEIELTNTGSGLGFGLVEFKGRGVAVKTIVKGGAAALGFDGSVFWDKEFMMDGRLETGDLLLSINAIDVQDKSRDGVVDILKVCRGPVKLVITRETVQVPSSISWDQRQHQQRGERRGGPRRGGGFSREVRKDHGGDQRKELQVTVQNEIASRKEKSHSQRKVLKTENLTISVAADSSSDPGDREITRERGPHGRGRGDRGGRGRGARAATSGRDEAKYKEREEKKQANIDLVEAEIQAMRKAYEAEKKGGTTSAPAAQSVYSFLDDRRPHEPSHASPEASQPEGAHQEKHRSEGSMRSQHSWGGQQFDEAVQKMSSGPQKTGGQHSSHDPQSKEEMQVTMTGKERQEYELWKREREIIDQDRLARHQKHTQGGRQWGKEWGKEKQETDWSRGWDDRLSTEPTGEGETESGGKSQSTWSSKRADNYRDIRVYGDGGFGSQSTNGGSRSSSKGEQDSSSEGHEAVTGFRGRGRGARGARRGGRGARGRGRGQNRPDIGECRGDSSGQDVDSVRQGVDLPATPQVVSPAESQGVPSARPQGLLSAEPQVVPPAAPQVVSPAAPQVVSPAAPQVVSPAAPQVVPSAEPHVVASVMPQVVFPATTEDPGTLEGEGALIHGGCPPEGALAQPIGVWKPHDQSDVTLPEIASQMDKDCQPEALTVQTSFEGSLSPANPLSPGAGWTTPTDHTHVVDWAAEANTNSTWVLPPTSPTYAFNPTDEAAASANRNWGVAEAAGAGRDDGQPEALKEQTKTSQAS